MVKLKIIIIGPCASGKTKISNFLGDASDNSGIDYHPTQGVRILEFESSNLNTKRYSKADIELWDCSGDRKFEGCWPAFQHNTHGVIFVYNPAAPEHHREMEVLFNYFVAQTGFNMKSCLVIAHRLDGGKDGKNIRLSNSFQKVHQITANIEESSNRLRQDFHTFLSTVLGSMLDQSDQEELNIIND